MSKEGSDAETIFVIKNNNNSSYVYLETLRSEWNADWCIECRYWCNKNLWNVCYSLIRGPTKNDGLYWLYKVYNDNRWSTFITLNNGYYDNRWSTNNAYLVVTWLRSLILSIGIEIVFFWLNGGINQNFKTVKVSRILWRFHWYQN